MNIYRLGVCCSNSREIVFLKLTIVNYAKMRSIWRQNWKLFSQHQILYSYVCNYQRAEWAEYSYLNLDSNPPPKIPEIIISHTDNSLKLLQCNKNTIRWLKKFHSLFLNYNIHNFTMYLSINNEYIVKVIIL